MKSKIDGQRFLQCDDSIIPIGIASMSVDPRISGFEVKCTECRGKYPVRVLNEGGYCETCELADFEEAAK